MRDIKFRAWDVIKKEMVYNVGISLKGNPIKEGYQWYNPESTSLSLDIMQYINLKDKNGKEIYEGDILNLMDNRYEIIFEQGDYQTGFKKKSGNSLTDIGKEFCNKFEIIGHIYENPELLNGK